MHLTWCDGQDEEAKEDYSHLPPNQQKKKLTEKIDNLKSSLAKHTAARSTTDVNFILKPYQFIESFTRNLSRCFKVVFVC